jgi:hypothetical protein
MYLSVKQDMLDKFIRTSREQKLEREAQYCEYKQTYTSETTGQETHRLMHEDNHILEAVT